MIFKITTVTICKVDDNEVTTILSTESNIEPMEVQSVKDTFIVTQSQKDYNYITLGKYSNIQLPRNTGITVKSGSTIAKTRTHKTQFNRFDKMKEILLPFSVGDCVTIEWNESNNTIIIS